MSDGGQKSSLKNGLDAFFHLLWPRLCLNCQNPLEAEVPLCEECAQQMLKSMGGTFCPRCGHQVSPWALVQGACPQCLGQEFQIERLLCCGLYEGPLRQMIIGLKRGRSELAEYLGSLLQTVVEASELRQHIDMMVPVPLHWTRHWRRGYNQAQLLARSLGIPLSEVLRRVRRTSIQPGMISWAARQRNVAQAFAVKDPGNRVVGQRLCLVDDVKTSGATLNECARMLREAGAVSVWGLVLAVAGQGLQPD